MHFAGVALLDDLLPPARQQLPELTMDGRVPHRVLDRTTFDRHPSSGDLAGGVHVGVQVQRHLTPPSAAPRARRRRTPPPRRAAPRSPASAPTPATAGTSAPPAARRRSCAPSAGGRRATTSRPASRRPATPRARSRRRGPCCCPPTPA